MADTLLVYDALSFQLPAASAPSVGSVENRSYLAFADGATETAYTKAAVMPQAYAAGTLTAYIGYCMASAVADKIDLEVSVEAVTDADALDLDAGDSFDTLNEVVGGTTVPGTAGHMDVVAITLTNKDSVATGDMVRFKLTRDHDDTDDTATGDCHVLWMEIRES